MKTTDFLNTIENSNKKLSFILPSKEVLSGDLHITEVKNARIISTDCGGFSHEFEETVIQLWINENSDRVPVWTTKKASKIFDIVKGSQPFMGESEVYIEFGDTKNQTAKYRVQFDETDAELKVNLSVDLPQCKPASFQEAVCC